MYNSNKLVKGISDFSWLVTEWVCDAGSFTKEKDSAVSRDIAVLKEKGRES